MKRIRPWHIVTAICFVYIAAAVAHYDFDPKQLAVIGAAYDPGVPGGNTGYDGQFAYQIARDPVDGWRKVDVPAYRYQRILYPMAARVLALGQPGAVGWTLLAVNILAVVAGTWFTEQILAHYGVSKWYALLYGLNAGILFSARMDLTEPLAYGLVQAALWCTISRRLWPAAILFALAALTKETTLLFAIGVGASYLVRRELRTAFKFLAIVFSPFLIWQLVLLNWFGRFGIGSGGIDADPFQIVPLMGLWSAATKLDMTFFVFLAATMLPLVVIPTLIGLRVSIRNLLNGQMDLPTLVLAMNAAVMLIVPRTTYQEPLATARFGMGLIVALLLYAAARGASRGLNYLLLWMFTLILYEPISMTGNGTATLCAGVVVIVAMLVEWVVHRWRTMSFKPQLS